MKCALCERDFSILAIPYYCLECAVHECDAALARKEAKDQGCLTCQNAETSPLKMPCEKCCLTNCHRYGHFKNHWTPK